MIRAWAVRMAEGYWVGIWNDKEIAESICAKQPKGHRDTVVEMVEAGEAKAVAWKGWKLNKDVDDSETAFTTTSEKIARMDSWREPKPLFTHPDSGEAAALLREAHLQLVAAGKESMLTDRIDAYLKERGK